ncbi:MAG: LysR family transcriptional regulator [Bacillota bacterium]|nr:LysR family transcriptional regulator [Bacillota bacterium]
MEKYQLEYLVAIDRHKTISKAAQELHVSQPSITKAIQKLEEELGFPLFTRENHRLFFNQEGQIVLKHAQRILEEMQELISESTNNYLTNHILRIGSIAPTPLWAISQVFDTPIESSLVTQSEKLIKGLKNRQYDIIILSEPISNPNVICQKILDEQLYLALKPSHPLATFSQLSFQDINGYPLLMRSSIGQWKMVKEKFLKDSKLIVEEDEEIYQILNQNADIALFRTNLSITSHKNKEQRIYIPITDSSATLSFYAIYLKKDFRKYESYLKKIEKLNWATFKP